MHTHRWFLSCLSALLAAVCLAVLMLALESDKAQAQTPSLGSRLSLSSLWATRRRNDSPCGLSAPEVGWAQSRPSLRLQASGVPTYYLDDETFDVSLIHPQGNYWTSGCFETWTEAEVVAVVFRTTRSGACPILKRMSGHYAGCSGQNLWGDTSDTLADGGYYCTGSSAACQIVAPGATHLHLGHNLPRPAGVQVRGGFQLGWSCTGEATVYDIQLVYYGVPPILPADQTNAPCDCPVGCSNQTTDWVGGPINTRTGNYHYSREDISIAALGGPLRFERSYNSLETGLYTTPLGYGWTHNYDMDLTFPGETGGEPNTVIVKGCHGSRFRFGDNGDGTYTAWPGVWATLTRTTGVSPTYFLRGVDQSLYVFTSTGQLVEVRDPQGNPIRLTYSGGRLARVQDATGARFLAFGYDAQGRLTEVRDPISRTVRYGYSPAGDLTVVTDTRGFTWTFVYTGTHLLYEIRDPLNRMVERTDYDVQGWAVRQWDGLLGPPLQIQYDAGGVVTITDPLGNVTVDRYNGYGTLASQSTVAGISRRTYDANLNWKTTTDANGHITGYAFNAMGLPERVTDALGNVTRMAYDGLNHLVAVTDALTQTTRYQYQGNLLITVTDALSGLVVNTYNAQGLLIRTVDHGVTTTYEYNSWGQRTAITDALGNVTRYEYDAVGRLITTTNPARQVTVNVYDPADHLIRVTQNYTTAGGQNWQNTYNLVTVYEYDRAGNRVAMTDTLGYVTRYGYDVANRLVSVTVNYSPTVGPNYGGQWNVTTWYGYDAVGNQVAVTDTLGRVTRNWYDGANRLISTTVNYSPTVGPNYRGQWNITTWYGYDAVGNRVAVTDTLGGVTRYGYDALNRLVVVTDALGAPTRYAYDALGRQVAVTDASGVAVYSTYDALGRLIQTRDALNHITRYGYDSLGRRAVVTDANGVTTRYEYDLLGRLTAVVENYRAGQPSDSQTNVRAEYAHDALGNRTVITDARGNATRYTYDALGRLVAEVNPLGYTTRYAYDALGQRTVITAADGIVTRYTYDALGRLSAVHYPTTTVQYAYDALGNRTAMTDSTGITTWTYDALNRPITISAPYSGTVGYRYDALGNRTQLIYPTGQVVTYTYDAANRLVQVTDHTSRITRYGYDPAGRLLTTTLPNGITTTYRYDGAGRLVNLTHAGRYWVVAAYTYTLDAVGNRIGVIERVLAPNPPDYLPLVMKNYGGGGGGQGMSAPAAEPQVAPFVSPLPIPEPDTSVTPFESPLDMPVEDSSSRAPVPFSVRLLLPDLSLPLFAPLALVSLAHRKRGWRWAWPLAAVLLVVAVVAIGMGLAAGSVTPAAALAPQPLLSPLPPPGATCTYPTAIAGSRVISYTYDPLYRLKEAAYSSGECYQYAYDKVGNRTAMTTTTDLILYQYDAANRLTNVDGVPYTWDNRGNLTSNGVFTYTYDAAGRMVRAQSITATLVYTYNGDGLLVSKSAGGQTTRYTWDLAVGLPQILGDGSTLYVPGVGEWSAAQGWVYYLIDGLGSVRQLADSQGYIVQRYTYGPFGEPQAAEGTRTSRLRYTGEQWDGDTGLVYLRARWYDPAVGRFTTPDPFPGFAALPQTQHPYVYVRNNPINLTDPAGKFAFIPLLLVGLAGGILGGIGYYALETYVFNANPCVKWDWEEALFWGGIGGVMGAAIGGGIYGGWWIGVQLGWWGPGAVTLGGVVTQVIEVTRGEMAQIAQRVNLSQATSIVQRAWTSASATYGQVNQYIINYYVSGRYVATIHQVETLEGEVVHTDFKAVVIEGIKYLVR